MLSNHLHNGIQTAMVVWSRVPSSEEGEAAEVEFASRSHGGTDAESLDYELVENYAYRKEQTVRLMLVYAGYNADKSVHVEKPAYVESVLYICCCGCGGKICNELESDHSATMELSSTSGRS
ncbi:chloride channel [Musa troglodytarum]|uniref:Chloride channel n=1 Tax=Musa troglodytarum TaxID=320322 RepID=A0A9E7HFG5_9LILI|nr:chloride channel [Musa troglodytarum]